MRLLLPLSVMLIAPLAGCSALPDIGHQPQIHNPFPQLNRVAVLPFFNQSTEPTVDGDAIALAYYNELQKIPGFEVMPVGVAKQLLLASGMSPHSGAEFQRLASFMEVDAVIVGSVTEYTPYYPPRFGLAVRWYAANPGFHPIPPGYGLPWATSEEEFIPSSLVFDAEFALAKAQLGTQTPRAMEATMQAPAVTSPAVTSPVRAATTQIDPSSSLPDPADLPEPLPPTVAPLAEPELLLPPIESGDAMLGPPAPRLPAEWPDPRGFVPPPPSETRPASIPQSEPVLSLTRLYHGNDAEFTQRLANYFYFRDDARIGDWQAYLQRSEDFIRFCCHLHVTELMSARGGAGKTRVVWRWPIGRYQR